MTDSYNSNSSHWMTLYYTARLFAARIQRVLSAIPYLGRAIERIPGRTFLYICSALAVFLAFMLIFIVVIVVRAIRSGLRNRAVQKTFGIADFRKFRVRRMRGPGTRHYNDNGANTWELVFPQWKFMDDGEGKQPRRANKVVWRECLLWLHDDRKTYIISTENPYDMNCLVHMLRDTGFDIAPCSQELKKQERLEKSQKSIESKVQTIIDETEGDESRFSTLCEQGLSSRGYVLSAASGNDFGIQFFCRWKSQPTVVRCHLIPETQLVNLDDIQALRQAADSLFAETCFLITTGKITVAAAGYAHTHSIKIIADEQLVALLSEDEALPTGKAFLRWELTTNDIEKLLAEDLIASAR